MSKNFIKMNDTPFYQDSIDPNFRFGDVLKGFVSSTPNLTEPLLTPSKPDYSIDVSMPLYCIIISPCCSIADQIISLSPLVQVRSAFFNNPFFAEDLTRINRLVPPDKSLSPAVWETMPEEQKRERLIKGMAYTFVELFVYREHEIFPQYEVHRKNAVNVLTKYYMVDFRNTFRVNCSKVKKPDTVPLEAKCLQLAVQARKELRAKIAFYYGRTPAEDKQDE
jgi:hypothetical protein